jgi:hypothetical protein
LQKWPDPSLDQDLILRGDNARTAVTWLLALQVIFFGTIGGSRPAHFEDEPEQAGDLKAYVGPAKGVKVPSFKAPDQFRARPNQPHSRRQEWDGFIVFSLRRLVTILQNATGAVAT